ncbi:hypothetical protein [Leptolyngbya sp. FACHB-261]|uniref:hypothetical protein n=1 Tax=Leptolyngbya sp. FACHB-261 TaxID=2692806 RepID=UPI0016868662|nr:hypothetical protein [Leptolyngbya sp. FACHB-261]MBD2099327.1 hypothetical protein [Leptolyngbya sp. FACHB-261]
MFGVKSNQQEADRPHNLDIQPLRGLRRCHLLVSDQERPLPGVYWRGYLYSFLKHFTDELKLRTAAQRLTTKGEHVLATTTAKGWALWVREEAAQLTPERSPD